MHDLARASDLAEAQRTIKVLSERLTNALVDVGNWKLWVAATVVEQPGGFGVQFSFAKQNGTGFLKNISAEMVQYYKDDVNALVSELVEEIYLSLYKEQIRNAITETVAKAVTNAAKVTKAEVAAAVKS